MTTFTGEAIVIDNGSHTLKAGFADDGAPRVVLPTVVGNSRHTPIRGADQGDYHYVGYEALHKLGTVCLHYPIRRGRVCQWGFMEPLWHSTLYNEVRVDPEEHPILLTEFHLDTKRSNERMAQILFESFNVPALYMANGALLSLFATGRITGVVLDMGDGCRVVPVHEGRVLRHAIVHSEALGGCSVSDRMLQMLHQRGYVFFSESMHPATNAGIRGVEYVREIKERLAYITLDYETDMQNDTSRLYELSDDNEIRIGAERFRCTEHLFRSQEEGEDSSLHGVQHLIVESINRCDGRLHTQLYTNIVLSGGSTMFRNFDQRLKTELAKLAPSGTEINIVADPERKYTSWIGGAMFASTSFIQENWVTRREYDEIGAACIHRCGLTPPLVRTSLFDQENQQRTLSESPFRDVDIFTRDKK